MSTTPRTDAVQIQARTCIHHNDAERAAVTCPVCLMRENAELRAIIDATLSALPVGNVRTHTPDSIAERVGDLAKAHADELADNEQLRKDKARLRETLAEIGEYRGEGGPATPWQDIVRDLGQMARAAIAAAMEAEISDSHEPKN